MAGNSASVRVGIDTLDMMMPMHLLLDDAGVILRVGPTLGKVLGPVDLIGRSVFRVFHMRRPRKVEGIEDARRIQGQKLYIRLRGRPDIQLIGVLAVLPGGGGILVNMSFGVSVVGAVGRFGLAGSDFAPTDLTLDLLYLTEAVSAAQQEMNELHGRLLGAKAEAEQEATSDTLTGLRNRRALDRALRRLVSRGVPFTLMNLDLDFFKAVNDTHGHAAGDLVLQEVARILREETRTDDVIARVGGDEFVLVFQRLVKRAVLESIAARIIARLEQPIDYQGATARISASIGLAISSPGGRLIIPDLLERADRALYHSKQTGRGRYTFFQDIAGISNRCVGPERCSSDTQCDTAEYCGRKPANRAHAAPGAAPPHAGSAKPGRSEAG